MMKTAIRTVSAVWGVCLVSTGVIAAAESKTSPARFSVELRQEYTDNRDSVKTDKESTFDTYFTPRLAVGLDRERTTLDTYYAPSLRYRSNPSEFQKEVNLLHDLGILLEHSPTPRLKLRARENFYYTDDPKVEEGGVVVNRDQSYYLNRAEVGAVWQFAPKMDMDVYARNSMKRYSDSEVKKLFDEDKTEGGITLWRQIRPTLGVKAMGRYTTYGYKMQQNVDRDFDVVEGVVGLDKSFAPKVRGGFGVGVANASFSSDTLSSQTTPYVEVTLRGSTVPELRLETAVKHSFRESDVPATYAAQEYTEVYGRAEWEARPNKVTLGGLLLYRMAQYSEDTALAVAPDASQDESTLLVQADVSVKVGSASTVKFAQKYESVSSDVREDYTKNTSALALAVAF